MFKINVYAAYHILKKCVLVGTFFVQRKPKHFVKSLLLSCVCVFSSFIFFTFLIYKYMNSISKIYRILYCVFFSVLFLTCVFASLLSFPLFSVLYIHCAVFSSAKSLSFTIVKVSKVVMKCCFIFSCK